MLCVSKITGFLPLDDEYGGFEMAVGALGDVYCRAVWTGSLDGGGTMSCPGCEVSPILFANQR
jgi:hypothetical protein